MGVEFGVLIPTREVVMSGRPETGLLLAMAERAEAAGFDSVWIGDSLTARPRHEPLTLMSAVAPRTRRVRLGTGLSSRRASTIHTSFGQSLAASRTDSSLTTSRSLSKKGTTVWQKPGKGG